MTVNTRNVMGSALNTLGNFQAQQLQKEVIDHPETVYGNETLEFSVGGKFHVIASDGQSPLCGLTYRLQLLDIDYKIPSNEVVDILRCNKNGCKQVYEEMDNKKETAS